MDLNTATFEEMQSLTGIGHDRAQAIFDGRANLSRRLTLDARFAGNRNSSRCGESLG